MGAYVRTGRSTGVSFGPVGALVMVIGAAFYVVAVVLFWLVTVLIAASVFVVQWVRYKRQARGQAEG